MDRAVSEPGAISEWTSTVFASLEATWFEFIHTLPKNILLLQNSGSMFHLVSIPSPNSPVKKSSMALEKAGEGLLPL